VNENVSLCTAKTAQRHRPSGRFALKRPASLGIVIAGSLCHIIRCIDKLDTVSNIHYNSADKFVISELLTKIYRSTSVQLVRHETGVVLVLSGEGR
ncbi:MAG: hypothetical protein KGJ27_04000, partial [candidate division NC10 bacterium]|nr:hypothetical protein [candidate division NC10 bacterium]